MSACEETYGIFPCSSSLPGSIFLVFVYGLFLLKGANLISDGSELLLAVMDPGLIGGLVLPILGALPDASMIIMSGMGGTVEEAQEQVAVGIGTLAGSTIMLLSIAWGGSLWLGRCDIVRGTAVNRKLTRTLDLQNTGVTTDSDTTTNSYIMVASAFLYLFPQVPCFLGYAHDPLAAGLGGIMCLAALAAYCAFQVIWPELQKRHKLFALRKLMKQSTIRMAVKLAKAAGQVLIDPEGNVREEALRSLFNHLDEDNSGHIDREELKKMMALFSTSAGTQSAGMDLEKEVDFMMSELDKDGDGRVSFDELLHGIKQWFDQLGHERTEKGRSMLSSSTASQLSSYDDQAHELSTSPLLRMDPEASRRDDVSREADDDDDDDEDEDKEPLTKGEIMKKAGLTLLAGAALVALFSDPMVDATMGFSKATNIPAFFVSFIITPFASNASELVSSLQFAKKKKIQNISMTYSQVYGAVTMNNTMCLGLFLIVVWGRGLAWTFSSEVVSTMLAIILMGLITSTRVTFPLYMAFVSLAIYPLSLALVFYLDYTLNWN